jgi:high affinity Mn2+ porin
VQRLFVRQTLGLGGDSQKVDADINQLAGSQTADHLVLTVGKFYILDLFDTNKYANNARADFLNWSVINGGTFDFGGDAWSVTYGAAAEWYQGNWTLSGGIFDMSQTPAGAGGDSALSYGLDPTLDQFELIGEIENRYALWGQPGKITGFLIRGRMERFQNALDFSQATGLDVSDALAAVRTYQSRPGVSLNLEHQVTETVGLFARAGWADGNVEPWDNTDSDRTIEAGVSFNGKPWNRPEDTVGFTPQRHIQHPRRLFQRRRLGHCDRRRAVAASRSRTDHRGVLQLRHHPIDESHLRLSVHRQPGLQHRPRASECL